ncbi:MAG: hypothetical protein ACXADO_03160 [Candidatus Thorarchaeota archaeon]|jgi:hypothetical protein
MKRDVDSVIMLLDMLRGSESRQLPLREIRMKLKVTFGVEEVDQAIESVLDGWLVDKILDYDDEDRESLGKLVWFLRLLTDDESKYLRELSEVDRAFLRVLRNSESDNRYGVIRADIALKELQEVGHDSEYVPYIPGITNDFFRTEEGERVQYHYIIPEYEKSDEYNAFQKESAENVRKSSE